MLEVLVMGVAKLRPKFPACFWTLVDAGRARVTNGAHVAVTLDGGNGLCLPVIRSAELRSAPQDTARVASSHTRGHSRAITPRTPRPTPKVNKRR